MKCHYSLCYIQLESFATSYPHGKYNSMSCSIGTLIGSECGTTSSKLNITQEKIPISLCQKDVSNHFHTTSVTDISTEYDLILTRAGVFEYDKEYISRTTVCPKVCPISARWRMVPEKSLLLPRPHRQSQARS